MSELLDDLSLTALVGILYLLTCLSKLTIIVRNTDSGRQEEHASFRPRHRHHAGRGGIGSFVHRATRVGGPGAGLWNNAQSRGLLDAERGVREADSDVPGHGGRERGLLLAVVRRLG